MFPLDLEKLLVRARKKPVRTSLAVTAVVILVGLSAVYTGFLGQKGKQLASQEKSAEKEITSIHLSFVKISIDKADLNWIEIHDQSGSFFSIIPSQYFRLREFVFDANLSLDITVMNVGEQPLILTALGVEIVSVAQRIYLYGMPKAAKIYMSESYVIELPDIRQRMKEKLASEAEAQVYDYGPIDLHEVVFTLLEEPVYLEAKAAYRYVLLLSQYQMRMPNHAVLRLWAKTNKGELRSEAIEMFTW